MKTTQYFEAMRKRSDRATIRDEWIELVIAHPVKEATQEDGRIRRWALIEKQAANIYA